MAVVVPLRDVIEEMDLMTEEAPAYPTEPLRHSV